MENARLLDERLRKIISEVSGCAGQEIKKSLLDDFTECVQAALEENSRRAAVRFLALLRKAVEKFN
ncbi:MAG: hypothetical protein HPY89_01515 [Pelotomaculum sp.]|uniref:Uncharacterized protein n=1 Tax=Pelotomaculum thermopropionicum (strain DSM 13744 / JCM 10971 / SI) TaxID=370438 RepID=A5D0N3_PELTS|nr:hypothetical protein [Pelotomaculum sp.]BAF60203.1 hypothetical protein PTH_2022 [Pelotomaculum thermopropionicum SI]